MQSNLKRRRYRNIMVSWPVLIFLLFFSGWMSLQAFTMYQRYTTNVDERQGIKGKQDALEARISYLDESIERLGTQEGIEEEIQARLPYAKEGEQVIFIVTDVSTTTKSNIRENEKRWWQFWHLWE